MSSSVPGGGPSPPSRTPTWDISLVLPLLILLYTSTQPFYSAPTLDSLSNTSLDNYASVLQLDATSRALRNTAVLAAGTATIVMLLGAVAAWLVVRTRLRGRWLVDGTAFVPSRSPGLVARSRAARPLPPGSTTDLRLTVDSAHRLRDERARIRNPVRVGADAPGRRRARGGGPDERRKLVADLPTRARSSPPSRSRRRGGSSSSSPPHESSRPHSSSTRRATRSSRSGSGTCTSRATCPRWPRSGSSSSSCSQVWSPSRTGSAARFGTRL